MDNQILNNIITFLDNESRNFLESGIQRETRIEQDLKITGEDAIEFIVAFGKEFNVDVSNFMAEEYFEPEGMCLFSFFRRKKEKKH